ncbi:MAG: nuclear transport factor 2 family protein [Dehalococcoidales bacterium]|nr:MAG: nuclear transport factor 2 family protein [Dehalococcoidales bacterium]
MSDALETKVKSLENEVADLKNQLQVLNDIEDIKRLQCAYGYYLERWMGEEIINCFSASPEVSGTFVEGTYNGPEGIRAYFGKTREQPPEFLHQVMQVSPVITVDPYGLRAKGRWYGYGSVAFRPLNGQIDPTIMSVVYEMEYIKEDGVWKILKLALQMHYAYNTRRMLGMAGEEEPAAPENVELHPDEWAEFDYGYPSGYIYPFHFVHPVTGKPTSEATRNSRLNLRPNPFSPG